MMTQTTAAKIHTLYAHLLREVPGEQIFWIQNQTSYTAAQLLEHVELGDEVGLAYAKAVLSKGLEIIGARLRMKPGITDNLDVSVTPRSVCVEQFRYFPPELVVWKTMSGNFLAGQMADLLEHTEDEAPKQYVTESLRLARDLIHRGLD